MEPRVTRTRYERDEALQILHAFILGGTYGPSRVPRGVAPEVVLEFVDRRLPPDGEPDAYRKALETVRFYELPEALPPMRRGLERLDSSQDLERACLVLEAIGDLGSPSEAKAASQLLDARLAGHARAPDVFLPLLGASLALAPHGSDAALASRIHSEVEEARRDEERDEAGMMHYDLLAAVERNELPRMRAWRGVKEALAPRSAVRAWVTTYLGAGPGGGAYLETWSARMARREAFQHDAAPVLEALAQVLRQADPRTAGRLADFRIVRAAQAILYLGGTLTVADRQRYEEAAGTGGAMNFLWDDP